MGASPVKSDLPTLGLPCELDCDDLTEEELAHIKRSFVELAQSSPHLDEEAGQPAA